MTFLVRWTVAWILFLAGVLPEPSSAFVITLPTPPRRPLAISGAIVDDLLDELKQPAADRSVAGDLVERLIEEQRNDVDADDNPFANLRGLYEVSFVKTLQEGENPVGGAWTRKTGLLSKLFKQRRSFQHILGKNETGYSSGDFAAVGEVVNVISLCALWSCVRATVLLRGDILPLTSSERAQEKYKSLTQRAVRAVFDSPRIVFGRTGRLVNINVGPKTSLVLDTPYVDEKARIGVGARSGTRFVFRRCPLSDVEANEFRSLLSRRPARKTKVFATLAAVTAAGVTSAFRGLRVTGSLVSGVSIFLAALIGLSGGGIEAGDQSVDESKAVYSQRRNQQSVSSG